MPDWSVTDFSAVRDASPPDVNIQCRLARVAPEVARSFEAGPEGFDLICIGGRKPAKNDGEKVDGSWN